MSVDPTGEDLKQFLANAPDEPFVMLNLLRYAPGGKALYTDYVRQAAPFVEAAGAEVVYFGKGLTPLAGDGPHWDAVLVVRYPSPAAFCAMVADAGYQEVSQLRTAALAEAVLQPTIPVG